MGHLWPDSTRLTLSFHTLQCSEAINPEARPKRRPENATAQTPYPAQDATLRLDAAKALMHRLHFHENDRPEWQRAGSQGLKRNYPVLFL